MGVLSIVGYAFIVIGILFSITIIGMIIGLPLIVVGALLVIAGKKSESPQSTTVIQQVSSEPKERVVEKTYVLCPSCKAKNEEDAMYCKKCGESLEENDEE